MIFQSAWLVHQFVMMWLRDLHDPVSPWTASLVQTSDFFDGILAFRPLAVGALNMEHLRVCVCGRVVDESAASIIGTCMYPKARDEEVAASPDGRKALRPRMTRLHPL
jgi:hypothetical protein